MPFREVESIEELKSLVGQEVSVSDWLEITQERVNRFAEVTMDDQWIHTDVERSKKESPFGVPIAHGFLTLALFPYLDASAFRMRENFKLIVNYGLNKLRFMAAVPVGSYVRARKKILSVFEVKGGWQVNVKVTIDIKDQKNPACIAEVITRYYP